VKRFIRNRNEQSVAHTQWPFRFGFGAVLTMSARRWSIAHVFRIRIGSHCVRTRRQEIGAHVVGMCRDSLTLPRSRILICGLDVEDTARILFGTREWVVSDVSFPRLD